MLVKWAPVASLIKEVNLWLAKRPLKTNGSLANYGLTSFSKKGHWCTENLIIVIPKSALFASEIRWDILGIDPVHIV